MAPTSSSRSPWSRLLATAVFVVACSDAKAPFTTGIDPSTACVVDEDGDGYGVGCGLGDDCDDEDPSVTTECRVCTRPSEGCACDLGTPEVECMTQKLSDHDTLICTQGSRFCRDGVWGACEGANVFEVDVADARASALNRAIVGDAGPLPCSPCRPGCFPIRDDLNPASGPLDAENSSSAVYGEGGGITVRQASAAIPQVIDPGMQCTQPFAPADADCDGIPDVADDTNGANTDYGTTRATVFMDLIPGESESARVALPFRLRSADVYFLVDATEAMAGVAQALATTITSGNYLAPTAVCADSDLDGMANDELKTQGIAGNVRCLMPESELGAGFVREIPFLGPDANGVLFGDDNEYLFEQRVDIASPAASLSNALSSFTINASYGGGNAQMQGLRVLATGAESYVGWNRPAVPARLGCAASAFGYACFRTSALPIVVLMTAEPMHNGPTTSSGNLGAGVPNAYPNDLHAQQVQAGSHPHYLPVGNAHESYASPLNTGNELVDNMPLGAVDSHFVTFFGDSTNMAADVAAAQVACPGLSASGPDAVFRFQVDQPKTLTVSTEGTRFDSVLGIVRARSPITLGTPSDRSYDFPTPGAGDGTPNNLGTLPDGVSAVVRGDLSGASADYPREVLGCFEQGTFVPSADSTDYGADVAFRLNLEADMNLTFQVPAQATVKSLSLFTGQPNLGDMDVLVAESAEEVTVAADMHGNAVRLISGYTGAGATRRGQNLNTSGLEADLPADAFASVGCNPGGGTPEASPDSMVDFTLSQPTRVRIETTGDAEGMGADFEHMLGLVRRGDILTPIEHAVSDTSNETFATAYDIPEQDFAVGGWSRVSGSVWNAATSSLMNADLTQGQVGGGAGCGLRGGGATASPDAVFSFTLNETRTIELDTENSSYRTFLSLHEALDLHSDNLNDTQASARDLGTLNGKRWSVQGSTGALTIQRDYSRIQQDASIVNGVRKDPKILGCNADSPDAVFKFTLAQATNVRLDTVGSAYDTVLGIYDERGPDYFEISGNGYYFPSRILPCNDDVVFGNPNSQIVASLPAGTYYVVVAGWQSSRGTYQLNITDLNATAPSTPPLVACDSGSFPQDTERSRLVRTLGPGTYYLVLKGDETQVSPNYDYQINIREILPPEDLLTCAYRNSGIANAERAVIEEILPAGDYTVVVRGVRATDQGSYRLTMRDLDTLPSEIGCHDTKADSPTSFTRFLDARDGDGTPIDYWLVLRGVDANAAPGSDPYAVYIRDASLGLPLDACDALSNGSYTGHFEPGDYYAVVKGRGADDKGWYQLSMGDPALITTSDYSDLASYVQARNALTGNGVRVIGAQIGNDGNLREQLSALASDTRAVDRTNMPLVVQAASGDPQLASNLGTRIVAAIAELAGATRMNVGLRLNQGPSNPPKPFTFSYQAVDTASDGCGAPINQVHQDCGAGSTPQFSFTFANPSAPDEVPPNPADTNGGYYMTLEIVGDGRYVLERIPVYIVPSDIAPERPQAIYADSGSYWQDIGSPYCLMGERPTWNRLSWDASIPNDTSLTFRACTAESDFNLGSCALRTLATVTAGGACAQNSDCTDGFCVGNVCQYAEGPECGTDLQCGDNGVCRDGSCRWTALPIDPGPALLGQQGNFLRLRVDMQASADRERAPSVYNLRMDYECGAAE